MKKICGALLILGSLLFAGVAQADIIGQQPDDSTQVVFVSNTTGSGGQSNVFQLPLLNGKLKAFDAYLSMSSYNFFTAGFQADAPALVQLVFGGAGCPALSEDYSAADLGIPVNTSYVEDGVINKPAKIHFTIYDQVPTYVGQAGCTLELFQDGATSVRNLSTQVATGTTDQIYFVGYDNYGPIPHITSASITSSNASTTLAKAGDVVTLSFGVDEAVQAPQVTIGGQTVAAATTTVNSFEATTTLTQAISGPIPFTIQVTSTLGDDSVVVSTTTDGSEVVADMEPPTITADSRTTNEAQPLIGGTAADAGTGLASVVATVGGTSYPASTTAGTWSVTLPNLPEGTYAIAATAVDYAGNQAQATGTLVIDRTPPSLQITDGPADGSLTNQTAATFTFTADAPTVCSLDGGALAPCAGSFATSSLSAGTHLFTVSASDDAGNTTTVTRSWSIDTAAPILKEVAIATSTEDSTPTYVFSSSKAGTIAYGGSCTSTTTAAVEGDNTITFGQLSPGTYSDCTLAVTDAAGNVSNTLQVSAFTITTAAPPPPPPPTDKDQCKEGGWRRFLWPLFKNQGDCVSFIVSHKYHDDQDNHGDDYDQTAMVN